MASFDIVNQLACSFIFCALTGFGASLLAAEPPASLPTFSEALEKYRSGDFERAAQMMKRLQTGGNLDAGAMLGLMYLRGKGVTRNRQLADQYSNAAAAAGVAIAQTVQGELASDPAREKPDYATAARWYALAAQGGDAQGQANLGALYFQGLGVAKDPVLGLQWTRRAAEQGSADGQGNLATAYRRGVGVPVDYQKALYWYGVPARLGSANCLYELGTMYVQGQGGAVDLVRAYAYFDIAGHRGSEKARAGEARLDQQLSAVEVKRALNLSTGWKPGDPLP